MPPLTSRLRNATLTGPLPDGFRGLEMVQNDDKEYVKWETCITAIGALKFVEQDTSVTYVLANK
jgi:hypothetical protein